MLCQLSYASFRDGESREAFLRDIEWRRKYSHTLKNIPQAREARIPCLRRYSKISVGASLRANSHVGATSRERRR